MQCRCACLGHIVRRCEGPGCLAFVRLSSLCAAELILLCFGYSLLRNDSPRCWCGDRLGLIGFWVFEKGFPSGGREL